MGKGFKFRADYAEPGPETVLGKAYSPRPAFASVIEALIDIDPARPVITGAIFGLAIVVTYELSDMISPQLILRLLRLLLPMITVVVAVFVIALPFRGLSNLFGSLSAGAVMIGMAITATSLVSAAIARQPGFQ